jgi:hypothetical protein
VPAPKSYERYAIIRVADNTNDQLTAAEIDTILTTSVTQEDFQTGILSQLKRIIWGDETDHWYQDFIGAGLPSLSTVQPIQGAVTCIDVFFSTTSPVTSDTLIPANALILSCTVVIDSTYLTGVTITIGRTGAPSLLQGAADNSPQNANTYNAPQRTSWGATELPVLITLAGSSLTGSGTATIEYTLSDD